MRLFLLALLSLLAATPALAQSDAVFESRNNTGSMTIEEYNHIPKGMLLTPEEQRKLAGDAKKDGAALDGEDVNASTPTSETMGYLLSYEEILRLYRQGKFTEAASALQPLLASEHPGAQELMGIMYRQGQGMEKDPVKAFELLSKAADDGRPLSQHHIAGMYFTGEGTAKDTTQALYWIGLAVIYYPDGPEREQARRDRDNIFLQASRLERDNAQQFKREWLTRRGEAHLLDLQ